MGTFADAATSIRNRMEDQWTALRPSMRILWGNERLTPAPDPNSTADQNGWIAVEINSGAARSAAFGGLNNNRWRQSGEVVIRIFVPTVSGEDLVRAIAADAVTVFQGWQAGDLKFFAAATSRSGIAEDGNWYEMDVIASFFFDLIG